MAKVISINGESALDVLRHICEELEAGESWEECVVVLQRKEGGQTFRSARCTLATAVFMLETAKLWVLNPHKDED